MLYHDYDVVLYFYIYAFIGWGLQTLYIYLTKGKVTNRGLLNQPLILSYGFMMISLIFGSGVSQSFLTIQFVLNIFRVIIFRVLGEFFVVKLVPGMAPRKLEKKLFALDKKVFLIDLLTATVTFGVFKVLHPFVFLGISLIPVVITKVIAWVVVGAILLDLLVVILASRFSRKLKLAEGWEERTRQERLTLNYRIIYAIQKRMNKAYPELAKYEEDFSGVAGLDEIAKKKGIVFGQGIGVYKLVWVCLITGLLGDGIETIFVRIVGGTWMRRSGVVFGPISIVWGVGAVLLTIILYRLADKSRFMVFLGGFFLGGTYEYMASVFVEVFFHTKFWDYSNIPLNIDGRTNVPYMIGWGFLALVWVCMIYPVMSKAVETFPPMTGTVITWLVLVFLTLDMLVTAAVMVRYTERKTDTTAYNIVEEYLDAYYTDEDVETMWPNLVSMEK